MLIIEFNRGILKENCLINPIPVVHDYIVLCLVNFLLLFKTHTIVLHKYPYIKLEYLEYSGYSNKSNLYN